MALMKWWGWGLEGVEFTHEDKPDLAPFIDRVLGVDVRSAAAGRIGFDELQIPAPDLPGSLCAELERAVTPAFVSVDPLDRVAHARGNPLKKWTPATLNGARVRIRAVGKGLQIDLGKVGR